jgi:hypothetical protein
VAALDPDRRLDLGRRIVHRRGPGIVEPVHKCSLPAHSDDEVHQLRDLVPARAIDRVLAFDQLSEPRDSPPVILRVIPCLRLNTAADIDLASF